jgi:hypothetical protein
MPLSPEQRIACERAGVEEVRAKMTYAGPGPGAVVPGLGDGLILRQDAADRACGASASISRPPFDARKNGGVLDGSITGTARAAHAHLHGAAGYRRALGGPAGR